MIAALARKAAMLLGCLVAAIRRLLVDRAVTFKGLGRRARDA